MPVDTVDYSYRAVSFYEEKRVGLLQKLRTPPWEVFYDEKVRSIFEHGGLIIDIGGGLRIDKSRSNRVNTQAQKKYGSYLTRPSVTFKVTDYTDKYAPDFVEDIHHLSFQDSSIDSLFCIAVLEHVYDPKKAAEEVVRVLKPGGTALLYIPFIYRYHAHSNDYRDYFRYTKDGIAYLFRECTSVEICPVRGLFESLLRFLPLHRIGLFRTFARFLDVIIPTVRRLSAVQTSGYHVFITK